MADGLRTKPPDLDATRARAEAAIKRLYRAQGQPRFDNSTARMMRDAEETLAALLAEIERLRTALEHSQAAIGLATTYIPAARFEEFVNRRAALAHPDSSTVGCAS